MIFFCGPCRILQLIQYTVGFSCQNHRSSRPAFSIRALSSWTADKNQSRFYRDPSGKQPASAKKMCLVVSGSNICWLISMYNHPEVDRIWDVHGCSTLYIPILVSYGEFVWKCLSTPDHCLQANHLVADIHVFRKYRCLAKELNEKLF